MHKTGLQNSNNKHLSIHTQYFELGRRILVDYFKQISAKNLFMKYFLILSQVVWMDVF